MEALNLTTELVGETIRAWDFEPCEGRADRYVEGIVTEYMPERDRLVIEVAVDSTGMGRTVVYTPPLGRIYDDEDPITQGYARIQILDGTVDDETANEPPLEERIKLLYAQRAITGGHSRRARITAQIKQLEAELARERGDDE